MPAANQHEGLSFTNRMQDHRHGAWTETIPFNLPWDPRVRPSLWGKHSLAPYRRFKKLYGERKFAQNYPSTPFRLLDLPAELRNIIYRKVLVFDRAIEYAAQSTSLGNITASTHQLARIKRQVAPRLRLLRTNRQVNEEASSIYYGENEFRFSNVEGWYWFSAFLRTIGPQNQKLLRSITIHAPWFGICRSSRYDAEPESSTRLKALQRRMEAQGLKHAKRFRNFDFEGSVRHSIKVIEEAGALEELKIVLPDSYELEPSEQKHGWVGEKGCMPMQEVLDPAKFPHGLKVTLVRLHGGFRQESRPQQFLDDSRRDCLLSHVDAWDWFEIECGWEVETMVHDFNGKYPVPLKRGDRIIELRGVADPGDDEV